MTAIRKYPLVLVFVLAFFAWMALWAGLAHSAPTVPDPGDHPVDFWEAVVALRQSGGLYLAAAVALAAVVKAAARMLAPVSGHAEGWRARSITVLSAVALVLGSVIDMLVGSMSGAGVAMATLGAAAMLHDPRNKTSNGAVTKSGTIVMLVLLLSAVSCTGAQQERVIDAGRAGGAAGVDTMLKCKRADFTDLALEAYNITHAFLFRTVSGAGEVDTKAIRDEAKKFYTIDGRCAFAAALSAVTAAMSQRKGALGIGPSPSYLLHRALADVIREDWRVEVVLDGEELAR